TCSSLEFRENSVLLCAEGRFINQPLLEQLRECGKALFYRSSGRGCFRGRGHRLRLLAGQCRQNCRRSKEAIKDVLVQLGIATLEVLPATLRQEWRAEARLSVRREGCYSLAAVPTVRPLVSTLATPSISRAIRVAASSCAWVSTWPRSVTTPLSVSTLISRPDTSGSASSDDFTLVVIHVSSIG